MSSNEIETQVSFTVCNKETKQIAKLLEEYEHIKRTYEETNESKKMKAKALEVLDVFNPNYDRALTLMNLAVKIIKACNGLQK